MTEVSDARDGKEFYLPHHAVIKECSFTTKVRDIAEVWLETRNELAQLDNFSCPRRVMLETSREIQLHGYCDASERAYGACIYIRTLDHSDGMRATKIVIHKCIRCFRVKPKVPAYIMGDLPKNRVTRARPFQNVGVDYCGSFFIKEKKDLTTESCLGAFKRFFARRGKATNIYSDNGTNFVGAKNEITEVQRFLSSNEHNSKINRFLSDQGINWHFSPPRSPHFGGLWEAAVKSFKGHLYKTIGNELFTFEQLNTYIIEVEAILNSRPLTPLSSDPNDLTALSPSHFLIGDSLMQLPEYDLRDTPVNKLSSWQHIQRVKQHFWNRWSNEYLQTLHTRNKWHIPNDTQHKKGTLVIIREDNTPPLTWKLGRIIDICPGGDKIVRVATVKTAQGTYQRAIKKLSPLPIDDPE
ncbi:uncharacterized protein LOC143260984 [Megalopta genalis]|uniref:uncharacterized protein LOC143260984 n=1 Tax=Megalopta genalis TaxID=115081 RepID=UPI003FD1E020